MKIISIDVGIKNLALCLFSLDVINNTSACEEDNESGLKVDKKITILKWDVVNLTQKDDVTCCGGDTGSLCTAEARFSKNGKYYCLKHSKKEPYQRPNGDFTLKKLKKQKVPELREVASKHCIEYDTSVKKAELIDIIFSYGEKTCFDPVDKVDATKLDIVTIGRNIQHKLNIMFKEDIDTIDMVIIENQISPIANRMKTIQGMLSQYFLMQNSTLDIEFISSINKLKDDEIHDTYAKRKKAGIKKCLDMIEGTHDAWVHFFQCHKKNDDLADCFLQGMWYIQHRVKP